MRMHVDFRDGTISESSMKDDHRNPGQMSSQDRSSGRVEAPDGTLMQSDERLALIHLPADDRGEVGAHFKHAVVVGMDPWVSPFFSTLTT